MSLTRSLPLATLALVALLAAIALDVAQGAGGPGKPKQGKQIFLNNRILCGSCHTLKAARSTGRDGPNLDRAKPGYARIVAVVTKGRNPTKRWPTGMPFYTGKHALLSKAQVRDVAAFVYNATHK